MSELVSLIVPIYNGEKYIERFYELFKKQSYSNIELVLIDDGSIDATHQMLDELAQNDSRVVVYHKENGGVSSARNLGIRKAKGTYLSFADVDDYVYPEYIQYMYQLLKKNDADIAFCSYLKMSEKEDFEKEKYEKDIQTLVFSKEEAIENFCYRKYLTGYSYLKLIRATIAKEVMFNEGIVYGEDFLYSYELLKKCNRVVYGNRIQYVYIQYKNSATHIKRDNTLKYWNAWKNHMEFLEDVKEKFPKAYMGAISKCYVLAINNTTRLYNKKRDSKYLCELYDFIEQNARNVLYTKKEKKITRMLGLIGLINVKLVCISCEAFFAIQELLGMTLRRTV